MQIYIPVKPMGSVRMTQKGKWVSGSAKKYLAYKQEVGYWLRKQCDTPIEGALQVSLLFDMAMPASWSVKKKQQMLGKRVLTKPDIDNLIKGAFDSANGILWPDDNVVCEIGRSVKQYSDKPGFTIIVEVIDEPT